MNISKNLSPTSGNSPAPHETVFMDRNPVRYTVQNTGLERPTSKHSVESIGGVKFMVQGDAPAPPSAYLHAPMMDGGNKHKDQAIEVLTNVGLGLLTGGAAALAGHAVLRAIPAKALFRGVAHMGGRPLLVAGGLLREAGQVAKYRLTQSSQLTRGDALTLGLPFGWNKHTPLATETSKVLLELHSRNSTRLTKRQKQLASTRKILGALRAIATWLSEKTSNQEYIPERPPGGEWLKAKSASQANRINNGERLAERKYNEYLDRHVERRKSYLKAIKTLAEMSFSTGLQPNNPHAAENLLEPEYASERFKVRQAVWRRRRLYERERLLQEEIANRTEINAGLTWATQWLNKP